MTRTKLILVVLALVIGASVPISYINYDLSKDVVFAVSEAFKYQSAQKITYDESGVPYVSYKYQNGEYVGEKRRNPVSTSQAARKYLEEYKETGDDAYKELFFNCSDWLVENAVVKENYSVWEYSDVITYPNFTLYPPWVSSMAQGLGVAVLAHAYDLTDNEEYLRAAKLALEAFFIPVEDGGVLQIDEDGGWWYLEYGYKGEPKPRTLNGFIYSLIGLREYYEITNDGDALLLFNKGAEELKRHLDEYDTGSYTVYDLVGTPASKFYHEIHVEQMLTMYNLTGDPIFLQYHEKWTDYKNSLGNVLKKNILNRLNIAIYIFNLIIISIVVFGFMVARDYRLKKRM